MDFLSTDQIAAIVAAHDITYEAIPSLNRLTVSTRMSRLFPLPREVAFRLFSDPATHVRLFSIIKGSATIPRDPIAKIMPPNQFWVVEHVEEKDATPRTMLVKYTLSPPDIIIKEGVPDPFGDLDALAGGVGILDKKKALVIIRMDEAEDNQTNLTVESTFQATTGEVFMRGLIDHVWLNFFENLMVELKELPSSSNDDPPIIEERVMTLNLSNEEIALIRRSFRKIGLISEVLAAVFYERLIEVLPIVRGHFKQPALSQYRMLVVGLGQIVRNLGDQTKLTETFNFLANKHATFNLGPAEYAAAQDVLIYTLKKGMGNHFTGDLEAAWTKFAHGTFDALTKNTR